MNTINERSNIDFLSLTSAFVAGACNVLSWIFLECQTYFEMGDASVLYMAYLAAFDGCFFLTPLVVVIIFRHVVPLTILYAVVLFFIVVGRAYYLAQFHLIGSRGLVRPFDVPSMLWIALSVISALVIVVWVLFRLMALTVDAIKHQRRL